MKKLLLPSIIILAAALRVWHLNWGLPELYEEAFPLAISLKFWNWGHAGFNMDPNFFNYPALTFYLNFVVQLGHFGLGSLIGSYPTITAYQQAYNSDPTNVVVLSRMLSVLFDVGTVVIVYRLAVSTLDERAGLLAAGFAAINPLLIKQSQMINVDTPL